MPTFVLKWYQKDEWTSKFFQCTNVHPKITLKCNRSLIILPVGHHPYLGSLRMQNQSPKSTQITNICLIESSKCVTILKNTLSSVTSSLKRSWNANLGIKTLSKYQHLSLGGPEMHLWVLKCP